MLRSKNAIMKRIDELFIDYIIGRRDFKSTLEEILKIVEESIAHYDQLL